jgi:hypothetical protein
MFLLGLLSIAQIVFLPGYLVVRALRLEEGGASTLPAAAGPGAAVRGSAPVPRSSRTVCTCVLSFALSLVVNHLLVTGLVLLGAYRPATMYAVLAVEAGLLLWTVRKGLNRTVGDVLRARRPASGPPAAHQSPLATGTWPQLLRFLASAAACALMAGFALHALCHAGEIFREWDAVVSWNRWASDWAANGLPRATAEYPQLLPSNYSITYVFIQDNSIWFFAKGFLFLFCLLLLAAMFDLGSDNFGYIPGVLITYALLVALLRFRYLSSGYAEMPVAFFAFTSVYALLAARRAQSPRATLKYVLVGSMCAAGAALTKQAGLFLAGLYPLLCGVLLVEGGTSAGEPATAGATSHARTRAWSMLLAAAIIVLLAAPWYAYKQIAIRWGADASIVKHLVGDIHQGRNLVERLGHAGGQLVQSLGIAGAASMLLLLAFALRDRVARWLVILIVAPFVFVWAIGFSYDLRNVALAIPFAGAAAGIGGMEIAALLARRLKQGARQGQTRPSALLSPPPIHPARPPALLFPRSIASAITRLLSLKLVCALLLLALPLVWLGSRVRSDDLRARQTALQRTGGNAALNEQLYQYQAAHGLQGQIASDYFYLGWLPGMEPYYAACIPQQLDEVRAVYERPEVKYGLFYTSTIAPDVRAYLESESGPGASRVLAEMSAFCFYEKRETR